jgi:hypothetical protein
MDLESPREKSRFDFKGKVNVDIDWAKSPILEADGHSPSNSPAHALDKASKLASRELRHVVT